MLIETHHPAVPQTTASSLFTSLCNHRQMQFHLILKRRGGGPHKVHFATMNSPAQIITLSFINSRNFFRTSTCAIVAVECCNSPPLGKPLMFAAYLHLYNMQVLEWDPQQDGHSKMIHWEQEEYVREYEKNNKCNKMIKEPAILKPSSLLCLLQHKCGA